MIVHDPKHPAKIIVIWNSVISDNYNHSLSVEIYIKLLYLISLMSNKTACYEFSIHSYKDLSHHCWMPDLRYAFVKSITIMKHYSFSAPLISGLTSCHQLRLFFNHRENAIEKMWYSNKNYISCILNIGINVQFFFSSILNIGG